MDQPGNKLVGVEAHRTSAALGISATGAGVAAFEAHEGGLGATRAGAHAGIAGAGFYAGDLAKLLGFVFRIIGVGDETDINEMFFDHIADRRQ